jgi:hypothetical protein
MQLARCGSSFIIAHNTEPRLATQSRLQKTVGASIADSSSIEARDFVFYSLLWLRLHC